MARILLVLLALSAAACSATQKSATVTSASEPMDALLWKIEGQDLTEPSYLYGTIHIISQNDFFLTDATKQAFDESQKIVLELDMDDPQMPMQMMQYANMPDGQTLDQLLGEDTYQKLDALVKKNMGMGIGMFNKWQPILAYSLFIQEFIDGPMASYEQSFMQMAQKGDKEIIGLETVKEQIDAIGSIDYQTQAAYLTKQINDLSGQKELFSTMVDLYKKQDLNALQRYIVESEGGDQFAEHLLKVRNEKWISRIHEQAKKESSFFAVGAGHLGGEYGVINLLRQAGFTVTKVK